MLNTKELLNILKEEHAVNSRSDVSYSHALVTGIVVDTDDPLQSGRLRIYCPTLNDDPAKLHHLPWAVYISPLAGSISNSSYARGTGKGPENTSGAVAYGWWGIPEQGAKVLVGCIEGDERRRFWIGCIPEHQETHTLFHGRYKWSGGGGTPDGPLSSNDSPIEPLYTNAGKAFNGDRDSREWKTRQAEYQATAVDITEGEPPNSSKSSYLDEQYPEISEAEQDDWVKAIVGAHGYDWTGNKALGSFKSSRVFGFSTPGGHAISFDDRAYNSRIRIRSATGHQLIMDDTNERIYLSSNEGNNWLELDSNGNIDVYAKRRVSVHSEKDINFTTDESFRVKAKKGIYMYAGDTEGQEPLDDEKPEDGEIRFHSTADTHLMSEKNLRMLVEDDWLAEVGGKHCLSIAENMLLQVEDGIDTIVNDGDYNISVDGDHNHHASGDTSIFSGNDNIIQAVNDTEMFSYTGKMDIGSQLDLTVKSYEGDITIEALTENMKLMSNEGQNQITMRNPFVNIFSLGEIVTQSVTEIANQVYSGFGIDNDKQPTKDGSPIESGCIRIEGVNVSFKPTEINLDALDNINMKWKDDALNTLDTSVGTINDSLDMLETRVNDFMYTTNLSLKTMFDNWLDPLPGGFEIPAVPSFPTSVTFQFPPIDLPEFDFDFCVDLGDFLNIENFNPYPDAMFGTINVDLGGWTKNNFKSWFARHKSKVENSIASIQSAENQIDANLQSAVNQIKSAASNIKDSLNNLVDISITSNGMYVNNYTVGVDGLNEGLANFNASAKSYNTSQGSEIVPPLDDLENEVNDHKRTVEGMNKQVQDNPSAIDGYDYSELADMANFFTDYSNDIGGP